MIGQRLSIAGLVVSIAALVLAGVALSVTKTPAAYQPQDRVVYMSAVEYKGSTTFEKEPLPTVSAPAGGGYQVKAVDNSSWQTSTYRWEPGVIVVFQGDRVTLKIWGVNGASHPSDIEDLVPSFEVKRGALTTLTFEAESAGVFPITCHTHAPSMQGYLVVVPPPT